MGIIFGKVTEVVDKKKFIIKFTSEKYIEDCIAYPIDTFDEPNVGDPIYLIELDHPYEFSYMWKKMRLFDHTRMKLLDSIVDIHDDHVEIHAGEGKSVVKINNDGTIHVESKDSVTVKTKTLNVEDTDTKIKATNVKVEATSVEVKGTTVNITGGTLKTGNGGVAAPTSKGGFCAIPICPLTGAPHIGDVLTGT